MESYREFAEIYDGLINDDINYEEWSRQILQLCGEYKIKTEDYLDVACGTGNMTVLLAPYFKNTMGVDLSEEMLFQAEEKLRQKRIRARFVCQNMKSLNLNRKFDLITCCLDAVNYLLEKEDLRLYFRSVYQHLKDNALFIFDINSHYKLEEVIGNNTFTYCEDDVAYIWENEYKDNMVSMFLTFFVKDEGVYSRFDEEHKERAYREDEIDNILKECGLDVKCKMDNYKDGINEHSERITYVVVKNNI